MWKNGIWIKMKCLMSQSNWAYNDSFVLWHAFRLQHLAFSTLERRCTLSPAWKGTDVNDEMTGWWRRTAARQLFGSLSCALCLVVLPHQSHHPHLWGEDIPFAAYVGRFSSGAPCLMYFCSEKPNDVCCSAVWFLTPMDLGFFCFFFAVVVVYVTCAAPELATAGCLGAVLSSVSFKNGHHS